MAECRKNAASATSTESVVLDEGCPKKQYLAQICNAVASETPAQEGSAERYLYQTNILAAACVTADGGSESSARKIQHLWDREADSFHCSANEFNVPHGSILKYAVSRQSKAFLNDAIYTWKLNLNQVDASDGRTVLDYIDDEMAKVSRDNPRHKFLERYRKIFVSNGAKHASEVCD